MLPVPNTVVGAVSVDVKQHWTKVRTSCRLFSSWARNNRMGVSGSFACVGQIWHLLSAMAVSQAMMVRLVEVCEWHIYVWIVRMASPVLPAYNAR